MDTRTFGQRFVGRHAERSAFDARLDDALRGDGSVTLVSGAPGVGKTSVVRAWLESARARGCTTAHVANFPFSSEPYAPVAELCRTLARSEPRALPRGEQRAMFARFLELLPAGDGAGGEPWQKRRLFVLVREFLARIATSAPIVVSIDDVQWLDPESLELLQYLTPHFSEMRAVLVLAQRRTRTRDAIDEQIAAIERHPSCYRIVLGALDRAELRELIFALAPAGRRISQRTIHEICDVCAGNPLFAEELVRSALRGGAPELPRTAEQSVNDRLTQLDPADVTLLEAAAVAGSRIDGELLAALFAESAADVIRTIRAARELHLLADADAREGAVNGVHFEHEFIRAAIEARLTPVERRRYHGRIASYLRAQSPPASAADLHRHVHGAGDAADAAVIAEHAGDDAMARLAFATARTFYEYALHGDGPADADGARVAEKLGSCYDLLGSHAEAARCFARCDAFARSNGNAAQQAAAAIRLALTAGRLSDHQMEAAECTRALALSAGTGPHAFAAHVLLALHFANRADAGRAGEHLACASDLASGDDGAFGVRIHVARAAIAHLRGEVTAWRTACVAAAGAADAFGDPALLANVWSYCADFARIRGDFEFARRGFEDAIAIADRYGLAFTSAKARFAAADMAFERGRVVEARRLISEAAALQVDGPHARMLAAAVGLPIALAAGDAFLCERLGEADLLATIDTRDLQPLATSFVAAHVQLLARSGDAAGAQRLIGRMLPHVRNATFVDNALFAFARYGTAEHAAAAATLFAGAVPAPESVANVHARLTDAVAAGAAGAEREAHAHAREAQALAKRAGTPLLEALAMELGGDPVAASAVFAACGCVGDVERLSARVQRPPSSATAELTRREREVAALIAEGLSNRAIAERLVLSDRTVEHHAGAIFSKLGFRSRAQLAAFISRSER